MDNLTMKGRSLLFYLFVASMALLSLFPSTMFAASLPVVLIGDGPIKLENFEAEYFVDDTEKMAFEQVQKQAFTASSNKLSLGIKAPSTWIKIKLENIRDTPVKLYLHHPNAYHNHSVDLYEVADGKLIRMRSLNTDKKETFKWMYKGSVVFDFALQPHEHRTLYIKSVTFSHQWTSLLLFDEDQSKRALQSSFTDIALIVGMLLALVIYNIVLFISSRRKESIFYACYLISGGIWIALTYGLAADLFGVYGSTALHWNLSLMSMPIFLILFMMDVFETKQKYPIEHWALRFILTLLCAEFIYGLFDIVDALRHASSLAALMMAITFSVGISLQIKKHPIARYFLLGHILFVVFSSLAVLFYKGIIGFNYINSHGVGIGVMLESVVLATIIAYRVRILERIKEGQEELKLLAATDPMTKLYNRRYFNTEADFQLELAKQSKQPLSVAVLDIDYFKMVNDNYGHAVGDKAIIQVAQSLKELCRDVDIVARFGGEEFVILLPNTPAEDAFDIIEKIRKALSEIKMPFDDSRSLSFTVSAGVAEVIQIKNGIEKSLTLADDAMYQAKKNGRNQSILHQPD